jgi:GT2 family glycosyltransferase
VTSQSGPEAVRPQLSVVIPTIRNYEVLGRVLRGFDRQQLASDRFEVLVVADCAEPDFEAVRQAIGARQYPVRLLSGLVPGPSGNRNVGWEEARAPIVLFTDDDTIPTPTLLSQHLGWHTRLPEEEVVVVGLVRWAPGIKVTPFMKWLDCGVQFDFQSLPGTEASWAHVYTSNSSIKRSFLERVGGFDDANLPYGYEDLDWGYRAREYGLRAVLNRAAVVDHWREMTVEQWQARAARLAVSEWRFCQLHPDVAPWFHRMFSDAARHPVGGRKAVRATRFVPRSTPWLGPAVWNRADMYWRQQIAPHFLSAWEAAVSGRSPALEPGMAAITERRSKASGAV